MTGTQTKLVEKLIADIRCERAKRCYESSSLQTDVEAGALDENQIREAFSSRARNCPFESGFGIQKSCSCPFCNAC